MCGICGIIDLNERAHPRLHQEAVKKMNAAMTHRGPDDSGFENFGATALAMRRLAIIDLATGQQPIYNEDGRICVFLNGEIYNYRELRENLLKQGHVFRTTSDTEVLAHLYEEEGRDLTRKLKGMFAFCIYDRRKETVFIARDRFGEKPLFYYEHDGVLSFSSELSSLLRHSSVPRVLNEEALSYHLKIGIVPEPLTLFKDIFSLPPGHSMEVNKQGHHVTRYFQIDYQADPQIKTEADCIAYLRPILENAVKRQMVSDVPLGAFLSGGIDSSTVVALMQTQSSERIKTFTVRFEERSYDESPIARAVATHLGTNHTEITVPNQSFDEDLFWMIIDHTGLPFGDSSAIPSYFVTREIRKHVTVALSGDGGDELFGGYREFWWWQQIQQLQKAVPLPFRQLAHSLFDLSAKLPGLGKLSLLRQFRNTFAYANVEPKRTAIEMHSNFRDSQLNSLYRGGLKNHDYPLLEDYWHEAKNWSPLRKIMYYRLKYNLAVNMLVKVDRMSMANSLEVRAPFLDPDLFEASAKLPDKYLIKRRQGKYIIRKLMKDKLPACVFDHPKVGFAIPLHRYQNEVYRDLTERLFTADNPMSSVLSLDMVKSIRDTGLQTMTDNASLSVYHSAHRLWSLLLLYGWAERLKVSLPSART